MYIMIHDSAGHLHIIINLYARTARYTQIRSDQVPKTMIPAKLHAPEMAIQGIHRLLFVDYTIAVDALNLYIMSIKL